LKIDDNLKSMGVAREVVNKIQKLRKAVKLNIDDNVEIYYDCVPGSLFEKVIAHNEKTMKASVKVPFLSHSHRPSHSVLIAETEYVNPNDEKDVLKLRICNPVVTFDESKIAEKYGAHNVEKVNFVNDVKSFVLAHNVDALKKKLGDNNGVIRFKLNDKHVELTHNEDFFFSTLEHVHHKQNK